MRVVFLGCENRLTDVQQDWRMAEARCSEVSNDVEFAIVHAASVPNQFKNDYSVTYARIIRDGGGVCFVSGDPGEVEGYLTTMELEVDRERCHVFRVRVSKEVGGEVCGRFVKFLQSVRRFRRGELIPWHTLYPPTFDESLVAVYLWVLGTKSARREFPTELAGVWEQAKRAYDKLIVYGQILRISWQGNITIRKTN